MKRFPTLLLFTALSFSANAPAQPAYLFQVPPEADLFGVLGCGGDGNVALVDLIVDGNKLPDTLIGERCLDVFAALQQDDVDIGPPVSVLAGDNVPAEMKENVVFIITMPGNSNPDAFVICKFDDTDALVVAGFDGDRSPLPVGSRCVDEIYAWRPAGSRIGAFAALLHDPGSGVAPGAVQEYLSFDITRANLSGSANPKLTAQLICDAEYGSLVVREVRQGPYEKTVSITPGESCADALDKLDDAGNTATPGRIQPRKVWLHIFQ